MIGILQLEFAISAIVWVPYSFLLFYLFREHYSRSRNLQSNILLFLACGSVFRCVWFWIDNQVYFVVSEVINRIALLLQFSGISLLMLMWSRAIAISKMTDVAYNETAEANAVENGRDTVLIDSRKLRIQRYQEATQAVMSKLTGMNRFQHYIIFTVIVNVCVWAFVMCSLASTTYLWYNINIIAISVACMVAALGTLLVGLWVSIALHVALSPVYVSSAGSATYNQEQRLKCVCMGRYGARCEYLLGCCGLCSLYAFIFNYNQSKDSSRQGLQMQREVLKVILSVSTITSFFFLLRSLCFMYRPVIEPDNADDQWGVVGDVSYPFFFYQIPELVPNLVIALGISPPTGVLRQAARYVTYGYRVAINWLLCGRRGSSARLLQPQQSVYDSECGTMSPAVRPSFLPDGSLIGTAPLPISSAPIAIPIRRNLDSNPTAATTSSTAASAASAAAQSAREKRNFKSAGDNAVGNSANPAAAPAITGDLEQQAAAGGDLQHQDHDNIETLSPVHDHANTANPANAKNSSLYSRDTGSIGNMSTFQVEKPSEEPKNSSLGSFFSFLGGSRANKSLSGRSTGDLSGSVGSYPTSPNSIGNSAARRRGSAPRNRDQSDYDDNDNDDEDDAWTQERRNSAEIAEMLYRINSFSTSEMTSGAQTLASSLTSGTGTSRTQSLQSVDSNTITNSRRHHIADIIGGNRSVTPGPSTSTTKRGWFS